MKERDAEWAHLLRAGIAGDEAAYARFLRAVAAPLRGAVRRGLTRAGRPEGESEDLVQETLLAIHLKRQTWDQSLPVMPWVHAIARYKLIDYLRRGGGRKYVPIDDFADILPADEAETTAVASDIERHLPALPKRQYEVVRAIALEGRSISETAVLLGMSEGAVRVALHRGLAALSGKFRS